MNTENYCKQLKNISVAAAVCCVIWLIGTFGRTNELIKYPPAVSEGHEVALYIVAIGYAVSSLVLVCLLGAFLYHQIKSLKNGTIFSKLCENTLWLWSALWPIYDVSGTQIDNLQRGYRVISIDGSAIGITCIVFTFAVLYKIARQVAEDNQLTI